MTKQKTEHEDTGQSMKTQHRDRANIPPQYSTHNSKIPYANLNCGL